MVALLASPPSHVGQVLQRMNKQKGVFDVNRTQNQRYYAHSGCMDRLFSCPADELSQRKDLPKVPVNHFAGCSDLQTVIHFYNQEADSTTGSSAERNLPSRSAALDLQSVETLLDPFSPSPSPLESTQADHLGMRFQDIDVAREFVYKVYKHVGTCKECQIHGGNVCRESVWQSCQWMTPFAVTQQSS